MLVNLLALRLIIQHFKLINKKHQLTPFQPLLRVIQETFKGEDRIIFKNGAIWKRQRVAALLDRTVNGVGQIAKELLYAKAERLMLHIDTYRNMWIEQICLEQLVNQTGFA